MTTSTPQGNEHALRGRVLKMLGAMRVNGARLWWAKLSAGPFQAVGLPDLILVVAGRFVACELKHPTDMRSTVTPLQARILRLIHAAGGVVVIARHRDDLARVIHRVTAAPLCAVPLPPECAPPDTGGGTCADSR